MGSGPQSVTGEWFSSHSTCWQGQPKVCVQQFHGQDEDRFGILQAVLVQFGLGIMCQEEFGEVLILGFFRSKSSDLEEPKIWGMDVEMGSNLRKYKFFGERSMLIKCSFLFVYLSSSIHVLIFNIFCVVFRWGQRWIKISDFMKVFKIVIWAKVVFICV